jgi:RHS repeat-associated protein
MKIFLNNNRLLAEYQPVTATKYYYTSDQINSTRIITDSSGSVVYSAVFDPYGGMQKQWVNTYSPSLKFSGKEREGNSELDYFGARYYDHLKYRFISVDLVINKDEALGNPQLWNLYAYCRNNPVTYLDPNGAYEKDVHYNLTKYLALQAGYSGSDAEKIAFADQGIDDNPKTSANPSSVLKKGFDAQKRAWHFSSSERVAEVFAKASSSGDLSDLGAALHCFQDSMFAHKKYRKSASHATASIFGNPDDTSRNAGMAIEMAQSTFDILNFFKGGNFKTINASFLFKVFVNKDAESRASMLSK